MKTVYIVLVFAAAIAAGLFLARAVKKWSAEATAPPGTSPPAKKDWLKTSWGWIVGVIPIILVIALAVMFNWREGWAKTPWDWMWTNWAVILTGVGLLLWLALRKKGGQEVSFKGLAKTLVPLAIIGWLWYVAYQTSSHVIRSDEVARIAAEKTTPAEPPNEVRMGAWEEIVPPGESSKWTASYSGYNTQGTLSAPAKYLKGKLVGKEVIVPDGLPLRWERPGVDDVYLAYGEAIRYFNEGTSPLVIKWSRTFK